jgi:hypothetical protein
MPRTEPPRGNRTDHDRTSDRIVAPSRRIRSQPPRWLSATARKITIPLRILAEYLEPMHAFHRERVRDTIVFFGSARLASERPLGHYYDAARELARRRPSHTREHRTTNGLTVPRPLP